jgi:uncharacterized membrane protein
MLVSPAFAFDAAHVSERPSLIPAPNGFVFFSWRRYCVVVILEPGAGLMQMHAWVKRIEDMLGLGGEGQSDSERKVLKHMTDRTIVSRDMTKEKTEGEPFGEWLADRVAEFGGSWTFISIFVVVLVAWALINTVVLITGAFDPYPFIFLNLLLSMLAALQAPIIMMAQNRQSAKDRAAALHDYEVNLKAELEIMALHEKIDHLQSELLLRMLEKQEELAKVIMELKNGSGK